jgi:hypothetical protein
VVEENPTLKAFPMVRGGGLEVGQLRALKVKIRAFLYPKTVFQGNLQIEKKILRIREQING